MLKNDKEVLETKFMDSFGMTLDQFERLDFEVQEELIEKVNYINKKTKKEKIKFNINEILSYYPIFKKIVKKK